MGSAGMLPARFGILSKSFLSCLTVLTPATCRLMRAECPRSPYEVAVGSPRKTNRRGNEREAREAERYGGEEDLFQHGHLRFLIAMSISRAAAPEVNRESARGVTACYFSRPRRT